MSVLYVVSAILISVLRTGSLFFYQQEWLRALPTMQLVVLVAVRLALYTALTLLAIYLMKHLLTFAEASPIRKYIRLTNRHIYLAFGVLWTVVLLLRYPGAVCWDSWFMLAGFRRHDISSHHSVFISLVMGTIVNAFESLGHANWGLFLYCGIELLLQVYASAQTIILCRDLGVRDELVVVFLLALLFDPYLIGYVGVAFKDSVYASAVILFTIELIKCTFNIGEEHKSEGSIDKRCLGTLVVLSLIITLTRKNGIYIVAAAVGCSFILRKRLFERKLWLYLLIATIVSFSSLQFIEAKFAMHQGSVREALSLPFQQVARCVRDHGDELSEQDRAIIDDVLGIDSLAIRYNPRIADPVKNMYNEDNTSLGQFLALWGRLLLRYPKSFVAATWEQNYYLFVPEAEVDDIVLFQNDNVGYEIGQTVVVSDYTDDYEKIFYTPKFLDGLQAWFIQDMYALHYSPPVAFFCNVAINVIVFLLLFAIALKECDRKTLLAFVPGMVSLLFIVIGPVIHGHPRYAFPIIFALPLLFGVLVRAYAEGDVSPCDKEAESR